MSYVRRNGVPRSDEATLAEHWVRHGDYLTLLDSIDDPVYGAEYLCKNGVPYRSDTVMTEPSTFSEIQTAGDRCLSRPSLQIQSI